MPMAMARNTWMKPPTVKELIDPRSQSTTKIRANVDTTYLQVWEGASARVLKRNAGFVWLAGAAPRAD